MVAINDHERYTWKHRPVIGREGNRYCAAVLPSGEICNRLCNWVDHLLEWDQSGAEGHWRHNPRPYRNY